MLTALLVEHKAGIQKRWFASILETYPADASRFLRAQQDPFLNPAGFTIGQEIGTILDVLVEGGDQEKLSLSLDNIIKIMAVQEFSPSQALSFVFLLKRAIKEELVDDLRQHALCGEVLEFERRVDDLALLAFDLYMKRREKIYEIRANEVRGMSVRLLERLSRIYGASERNQ